MSGVPQLQTQLLRAQQLAQTGKMGEAWATLAPLRPAIGNHAGALRLYALVAQSNGAADQAIDALKRLLVLENEPIELVGALADTLGEAGRHGEAFDYWTRLVTRQPGAIDAHLNRALAASSAGRFDDAVRAADEGLQRQAGHPRLLAAKGLALKNAGRLDEAIAAFEQAVEAEPARGLTRFNQAATLRAACRYSEASAAYSKANQLGVAGAELDTSWAAAALEDGDVELAETLYRRAYQTDPSHSEAGKGLTRLLIEYRGGDNAFAHYRDRARANSHDRRTWNDWVAALMFNKQNEMAGEVAREALRLHPDDMIFRSVDLFVEGITGDTARSLDGLERLYRQDPSNVEIRAALPQVALRARRPELAVQILEEDSIRRPLDQMPWAFLSLAWRMLGDPREAWLCDYDRLVMPVDVPGPDGMSPEDYALIVAAALDPLHLTNAEPGDQSLKNGTQTSGALFDRPEPRIQEFKRTVMDAAREAIGKLPDDPDHPFLSRKSTSFTFSGSWSVRLNSSGHHVAHVHAEGWMSSAYYARLPDVTTAAEADTREGWIEFGRPPAFLDLDLDARRAVRPAPGKLVLFPSYFWHGTIPFHDAGSRLTAAFDYQPAGIR